MTSMLGRFGLMLGALVLASPAGAALINHGSAGE